MITETLFAVAMGVVLLAGLGASRVWAAGQPLPEGGVEVVGVLGSSSSLVELWNGSLLSQDGRVSTDGGKSWSAPRSFGEGLSGTGIMRLQSGKLALVSPVGYGTGQMWISESEGETWTPVGPIKVPGGPVYELGDTMIQLRSGRLLYCWDYNMAGYHPDVEPDAKAVGTWKGHPYITETHQHRPEFFAAGLSWSDDEGRTWTVNTAWGMPNVLMGWVDFTGDPNGQCGINPLGESSIAELRDGRVLLFGRSVVGRLLYSISHDQGGSWAAVRPTELASSGSPPRLRRIPSTGDLLCVWNQVSGEEIRRGYRRGRLSAAISRDDGQTWTNFKTLEVSDGLDNVERITPEPKIEMVRARQDVGPLAEGYAYFHYSNVNFAGDQVYLMYSRGFPVTGNAEQTLEKQEPVLRIYPLEWFYRP